jgi:hypothetical protein
MTHQHPGQGRSEAQRERVRQLVAKLVDGTGLRVRELAHGLVITNPRDPERGQVHVAFTDGYVSWERVAWEFWGTIEAMEDKPSTSLNRSGILRSGY